MNSKTIVILMAISLLNLKPVSGQETDLKSLFNNKASHPIKEFYLATGGEFITSFGMVEAENLSIDSKLRISLFPHIQQQFHYNFGQSIGFYTGVSLINLGFINEYTLPDSRTFELRQRTLAVGFPIALKLGNMTDGNFVALGASAEIMTEYKTKFCFDGEKVKNSSWFADEVNIFNPSVFMDFRNKTGFYLRFKYYLNDFLRPVTSNFSNPGSTEVFSILPTQSTVFYVSIGTTFMKKKDPKKLTKDDV